MEANSLKVFFSSRRRHTISYGDWSSDVCSSDLVVDLEPAQDSFAGQLAHHRARPGHPDRELVQELAVREGRLPTWQPGHALRKRMRSSKADVGDLLQAIRAHVSQVQRRRQGAKRVVRTDVGGRLFAPDVLLAGRQRKYESAPALRVVGGADQASRQLSHELARARDEADVRSAEARRHTKLLPFAHRDVGAVLAGRRQDGEADRKSVV